MGNTLIEIKYIYRHKWTNPYKLSIFQNAELTFGKFGIGWLFPLPLNEITSDSKEGF